MKRSRPAPAHALAAALCGTEKAVRRCDRRPGARSPGNLPRCGPAASGRSARRGHESGALRPQELRSIMMHSSSGDASLAGILVVDDDRDTAESMACLLRLHGHDVRIALNGNQAIDVARSQRPRCVLLDIGLPGLDGYHVASRLRQEVAESMLLIAITGYGQEEDLRSALAAGFDHHFVKPLDEFTMNALLTML